MAGGECASRQVDDGTVEGLALRFVDRDGPRQFERHLREGADDAVAQDSTFDGGLGDLPCVWFNADCRAVAQFNEHFDVVIDTAFDRVSRGGRGGGVESGNAAGHRRGSIGHGTCSDGVGRGLVDPIASSDPFDPDDAPERAVHPPVSRVVGQHHDLGANFE